ncbi:RNA editing complex protein MP46 [Trypanosoma brucei brucei TREU927]|uniref:RNA editing complex protein MP46 n=2 Tax=Trypanosoma brucei TaxID=5691 RepID=Q386L2_TRYB2|nr:RNA editing complex protein MP46 [Trypanosoma brucei brucei TREU927]AAO72965.1 RNA editing complex protein MP46 [Trypanosoma brucei]EAN79269.1 RNA editing complex protein MP46 [Trypanosoma brucei brucei TREU927]
MLRVENLRRSMTRLARHSLIRAVPFSPLSVGSSTDQTFGAPTRTPFRSHTCLLCDVSYESWGDHAESTTHIARHAICRTFVSPERHNAVMQQLWKHIRLDFGYVDEVTHKKEDRRRMRLASTMRHLQEKGVLHHSLPRVTVDAQSEVSLTVESDSFVNYMFLGESFARQETLDRVARLMPRAEALELSSIISFVLSKRRLAHFFDILDMRKMVLNGDSSDDKASADGGVPPTIPRLQQDGKAVILFSCLGELQMFSRRDRSHSVATRSAAEQLVLNVLGTHVMENIIGELVHEALQTVVEEGTAVWREHCGELKHKLFEGTKAVSPPIATTPNPVSNSGGPEVTADVNDQMWVDLCRLYVLDKNGSVPQLQPTVKRHSWHDVARALTLELTVPNPVNKSAVFAAAAPRLATKKK